MPAPGTWQADLEDLINSFYPPDVPRQQNKKWQEVFQTPDARRLFGPMHEVVHPTTPQQVDDGTVVDRVLSLSVVSALDEAGRADAAEQVRTLLRGIPESVRREGLSIPHAVELYWFDRCDA